jgi:hypothetical protein
MSVVLVGAGRMGMRHLAGLVDAAAPEVRVVDPRPEARAEAERAASSVRAYATLDEALEGGVEAAVLAETAAGRLERVQAVVAAGAGRLLIEKPAEQSRGRFRELVAATRDTDARCNHHVRTLPFMRELREQGGPFQILVAGGAWGLACNGIHWIDVGVYLGGGGRLLFGELEETRIASPRGAEFCDFGGRGVFGFDDGSRLVLASSSVSSAPMSAIVSMPRAQFFLDLHDDYAVAFRRDPASREPDYRYGAGYERSLLQGSHAVDLPGLTSAWYRGDRALPTVEEAAPAHELLFDLLETGGGDRFPIT